MQQKFLRCRNQCWLTLVTFNLITLVFTSYLEAENWLVVLTAKSGDTAVELSFGVAKDATDDYDVKYDVPLPPLPPEKMPLSVNFANELTLLQTDIRGPTTDERKIITWTLNIDSEARGKITWDTNELPPKWIITIGGVDMGMDKELPFDQGNKIINITATPLVVTRAFYDVALQEDINLISVPLNPSDEQNENPWRLSELLDFIGPGVNMIIRYDKTSKKFVTYMPHFPKNSPLNTVVQGGEGYIVMMKTPIRITFTGSAWDGKVSLAEGINIISVPLNPGVEWYLSDLISFIGEDATMIIRYDKTSKKFVTYMPHFPNTSPLNTVVQGGEGYIVMMNEPANIVFTGKVWENTAETSPPPIISE